MRKRKRIRRRKRKRKRNLGVTAAVAWDTQATGRRREEKVLTERRRTEKFGLSPRRAPAPKSAAKIPGPREVPAGVGP
jgi:hypothetical protein